MGTIVLTYKYSIMPGRRRKKVERSSLEFEESPVHIVHKIQSPVVSADFPPTADVVPVASDTSIPWVSPQFNGRRCTPSRPRRMSKRRIPSGGPNTRSRQNSGNVTAVVRKRPGRYMQLDFLGPNGTIPQKSPIEEITIDNNYRTISCPDASPVLGAAANG